MKTRNRQDCRYFAPSHITFQHIHPSRFLNLGNSCYMNAVLQGLFHVEAFKDLLNVVPESSQETILRLLFLKTTAYLFHEIIFILHLGMRMEVAL